MKISAVTITLFLATAFVGASGQDCDLLLQEAGPGCTSAYKCGDQPAVCGQFPMGLTCNDGAFNFCSRASNTVTFPTDNNNEDHHDNNDWNNDGSLPGWDQPGNMIPDPTWGDQNNDELGGSPLLPGDSFWDNNDSNNNWDDIDYGAGILTECDAILEEAGPDCSNAYKCDDQPAVCGNVPDQLDCETSLQICSSSSSTSSISVSNTSEHPITVNDASGGTRFLRGQK